MSLEVGYLLQDMCVCLCVCVILLLIDPDVDLSATKSTCMLPCSLP